MQFFILTFCAHFLQFNFTYSSSSCSRATAFLRLVKKYRRELCCSRKHVCKCGLTAVVVFFSLFVRLVFAVCSCFSCTVLNATGLNRQNVE